VPKRCPWVTPGDSLYTRYHDTEWGVPVYDDQKLYEFLVLETFQAGLSWRTVLHKREAFKKAFSNFQYANVATYTGRDVRCLMANAGIIRNRQKIMAAINNAKRFMEVQKEFGSFSAYMWTWVSGKPIRHAIRSAREYPVHIPEAVAWSKDLKKRGFKFLGPTVVYAHMQAVGMVNDHVVGCGRRAQKR
jgi:DNA-3-methyladenine glycosylase I